MYIVHDLSDKFDRNRRENIILYYASKFEGIKMEYYDNLIINDFHVRRVYIS